MAHAGKKNVGGGQLKKKKTKKRVKNSQINPTPKPKKKHPNQLQVIPYYRLLKRKGVSETGEVEKLGPGGAFLYPIKKT